MMDSHTLSFFYKFEGNTKVFLKTYFIRVIRNAIIDPNTKNYLDDGFTFFDYKNSVNVSIPCDDSNWCEYLTYDKGFKLRVLTFPFSLKLHNDYFFTLESYEEYEDVMKQIIEFRVKTIKKGWAIKYGFEYENVKYPLLESLSEKELIEWVDPRSHSRYSLNDITPERLK